MAWSPRQLAELAGTSRRTVRHYHELGLLPEPARHGNGYQDYGVEHLIRLLRVRRLAGLGLTLPQIAELDDADRPPRTMLLALDDELDRSIARMQEARLELAAMLTHAVPADVPHALARRITDLAAPERALVVVLTRLIGADALEAYLDLQDAHRRSAPLVAWEDLAAGAGEAARAVVAEALAGHVARLWVEHADEVALIVRDMTTGRSPKRLVVHQAVTELYNDAQADVLARVLGLRGRSTTPLSSWARTG